MLRRHFIIRAASVAGAIALQARADHHAVSMHPRIVETDLGSAPPQYTPVEDFYIRDHFAAPSAPADERLEIAGAVGRPGRWSMEDLGRLENHSQGSVLECAGDPAAAVSLVSNGLWQGWRLKDVVSLAEPLPPATHVHCYGRDGFARSMPLTDALDCGMVATHLNGRPLTLAHGAPWRAVFPGWYGMNAVKWLQKIVLAEAALPNIDTSYTESRVASDGGLEHRPLPRVQVKSIIVSPANNAVVHRGRVAVSGLAWSGTGRISRVEVNAAPGVEWTAAEIRSSRGAFEWISWRAILRLPHTGAVTLACRATDDAGNAQPAKRDEQRLDGYVDNAYHQIHCVVAG